MFGHLSAGAAGLPQVQSPLMWTSHAPAAIDAIATPPVVQGSQDGKGRSGGVLGGGIVTSVGVTAGDTCSVASCCDQRSVV
jgi:hypothetical protein